MSGYRETRQSPAKDFSVIGANTSKRVGITWAVLMNVMKKKKIKTQIKIIYTIFNLRFLLQNHPVNHIVETRELSFYRK